MQKSDICDDRTVVSVAFQHLVQIPQRLECNRVVLAANHSVLDFPSTWPEGKHHHVSIETGGFEAGISRAVKRVYDGMF